MRLLLALFLALPWCTPGSAQQQPALQWFSESPSDTAGTRTCLGAIQGDFSVLNASMSVFGSQRRSISKGVCKACGSAGRCPDNTQSRDVGTALYVSSLNGAWESCSSGGTTASLRTLDWNGTVQTVQLQLCQSRPSASLVAVIVAPSLVLACMMGALVCFIVRRRRARKVGAVDGVDGPLSPPGTFELKLYTAEPGVAAEGAGAKASGLPV